jgi:hypothetical protein
MPSDEPSNRQRDNTGLRMNQTTSAPTLVGCGRACKLLHTTKGSTAPSCPVTQAYQTSFEASNTEVCMRASAVPDNCVITLSIDDVIKIFKQVNIHKAAGPDGLPGRVLRAWADKLASVFIDIFTLSLTVCSTNMFQANHHRPYAQEH